MGQEHLGALERGYRISQVRNGGGKDATCGDAANATGLARRTVHPIMEHGVELKPIRKIKAHRVQSRDVPRRLELRRKWGARSERETI